jgi:hypothetical protein
VDEMGRECSRHRGEKGEEEEKKKKNAHMILVGKPEGKRPPGRPRCRC